MTGSVVVRRSLGRQLHALRLAARKSLLDVDATKIVSKTKLLVMESGERPIKVADVMSLCQLYAADRETAARLAEMARHSDERGWWEDYSDVLSPKFRLFVELESAAESVFTYDSELLYGLLQTPAYHRAIYNADPELARESLERWVQFRLDRQRTAFERTPPLRVTSVLNEAVLVREVGGIETMREQREQLRQLNQSANVEVLVLPWRTGAHAAMSGPFKLVSFTDHDDPAVVYLETSAGVRYVDDTQRVALYRERAVQVSENAVSIEEYVG